MNIDLDDLVNGQLLAQKSDGAASTSSNSSDDYPTSNLSSSDGIPTMPDELLLEELGKQEGEQKLVGEESALDNMSSTCNDKLSTTSTPQRCSSEKLSELKVQRLNDDMHSLFSLFLQGATELSCSTCGSLLTRYFLFLLRVLLTLLLLVFLLLVSLLSFI